MANIGTITDQKINGSSSYTGAGSVTLTWSAPSYSGSFSYGPALGLNIEDGGSWGEEGTPSPGSITSTSYTQPDSAIEHVKDADGTATISLTCWGWDEDGNYISTESNTVTYTYQEMILSKPVVALSSQSGTSVTVSWSASTITGGSGTVYYDLYVGSPHYDASSLYTTTTSRSVTVPEEHFNAWGMTEVRFVVQARIGSGESAVTSSLSNDPVFVFTGQIVQSKPGTPTVVQNNDGTCTISWTASSASGGQGEVSYSVSSSGTGSITAASTTATNVVCDISSYGSTTITVTANYYICESYGYVTAVSNGKSMVQQEPSVSTPTVSVTPSSGAAATVSWTASTFQAVTGDIKYKVFAGSADYQFEYHSGLISRSITIPEENIKAWGVTTCVFSIQAVGYNLTNNDCGTEIYSQKSSVTFTYVPTVTLTAPGTPVIAQNNDGTCSVSWTASSASGGTGEVLYTITSNGTGGVQSQTTSATSANCPITNYGTTDILVTASYGSKTASSNPGTITFIEPSISAPTVSCSSASGSSVTLTWTASSLTATDGDIKYKVFAGSADYQFEYHSGLASRTITIPEEHIAIWNIENCVFTIQAVGYNLTNEYNGSELLSSKKSVTFTYVPSVRLGKPGTPVVVQNNDETVTVSWTAAEAEGGSGSVNYTVSSSSSSGGSIETKTTTSTSVTCGITAYGTVTILVTASYGGLTAFSSSSLTLSAPSLSTPTIKSIVQNDDGTCTINWTASTVSAASGLEGTITYTVFSSSSSAGKIASESTNSTTATCDITAYGSASIIVKAVCADISTSSSKSIVFYEPDISAPVLSIASASGASASLSWTSAELSNTSGSIKYAVYWAEQNSAGNMAKYTETANTSLTISNSVITNWGVTNCVFVVAAIGYDLTNTDLGETITSQNSNSVAFSHVKLSAPSAIAVTQNKDGTCSVSWTPSSASGGSGSVSYTVSSLSSSTGTIEKITTTGTSCSSEITGYGAVTIQVRASYSGITESATKTATFYLPSITAPTVSVTPSAGASACLTWNEGDLQWTEGTVTYEVYAGSPSYSQQTLYAAGLTEKTLTIPEEQIWGWGLDKVRFVVVAIGSAQTNQDAGETLTSVQSEDAIFTYVCSISLGVPGTPVIVQNNDGTVTVSWTAAQTSGSDERVKYLIEVMEQSDGNIETGSSTESCTVTYDILSFGAITIRVMASYGWLTTSATGTATLFEPFISKPVLTLSNTFGSSVSLSMSATLGYTTGDISFEIYQNGILETAVSSTVCTFDENQLISFGENILFTVIATAVSYDGQQLISEESDGAAFTYAASITLGEPGIPQITQNNDGTCTITWTAAPSSGGDGMITYSVEKYPESVGDFETAQIVSADSTCSVTCRIVAYGKVVALVVAQYGDKQKNNIGSSEFFQPSVTTPVLSSDAEKGSSLTLSWNAATLCYTDGVLTYTVYINGIEHAQTNDLTFFVPESILRLNGDGVVFYVSAAASELTNSDAGEILLSSPSNEVSFVYVSSAKTVAQYVGGEWTVCMVYYYFENNWIECEPYCYSENSWKVCSMS